MPSEKVNQMSNRLHPIIQILTLEPKPRNSSLEAQILLYETRPTLSGPEINRLSAQLSSLLTILPALNEIHWDLTFDPQFVESLVERKDITQAYYPHFEFYLLNSIVSWLVSISSGRDASCFPLVLRAINKMSSLTPDDLFSDLFIYLFSVFPLQNQEYSMSDAINEFRSFLSIRPSSTDPIYQALLAWLEAVNPQKELSKREKILIRSTPDFFYERATSDLLTFIDEVLCSLPISAELSFKFFKQIECGLKVFDSFALSLFKNLTKTLSFEASKTFYSSVSQYIEEYSKFDEPIIHFISADIDEAAFLNEPQFSSESLFKLPSDFIILSTKLEMLANASHKEAATLISDSFLSIPDDKYFFDIAASYLFLSIKIPYQNSYFLSKVVSSQIFDPALSIYRKIPDSLSILQLRFLALQTLIMCGFDFYSAISNHEWMLREVAYYIEEKLSSSTLDRKAQKIFIEEVGKIFSLSNKLDRIGPILLKFYLNPFVYSFSPDKATFSKLLSSIDFDEKDVSKCLERWNFSQNCVRQTISQLFEWCCNQFCENSNNIIRSILKRLGGENAERFGYLKESLCSILYKKLPAFASPLVSDILHFFSDLSYPLSLYERSAILQGIQSCDGNEPSMQEYLEILNIIAGRNLDIISPTFLIRQPKVVTTLISAFSLSSRLVGCLHFVLQLCNYSITNIRLCHEGGVDTTVLDLISKTKDSADPHFLDVAFSLLREICTIASSLQVAQRIINLMAPTDSMALSPLFFQSLQLILYSSQARARTPIAYLPITNSENLVTIHKFSSKIYLAGFSIAAWILIDTSESMFTLFELGEELGILVSLYRCSLIVHLFYQSQIISHKFSMPLVLNQWQLIVLSFSHSEHLTTVSLTDSESTEKFSAPFVDIKGEEIPFTIGSKSYKKSPVEAPEGSSTNPILLGPFAIYQNAEAALVMKSIGPRPPPKSPFLISVWMDIQNNSVFLRQKSIEMKAEASFHPTQSFPFIEILLRFLKPQILIPMFAQAVLPTDQKRNPLIETIDLFRAIFQCSQGAQIEMSENNSIDIISYLLSETNLTEDVFEQINCLLDCLINRTLKSQVFWKLILNADIWAKSAAKEKVIRRWQPIVEKMDREVLGTDPFFRALRNILSLLETENKNILLSLLLSIAKIEFTFDDLRYLVNLIRFSKSDQIVCSLLSLTVLLTDSGLLSNICCELFFLLHGCFRTLPSLVNSELIRCFVALHKHSLIHNNFILHVDIMIRILDRGCFDVPLLSTVIDLITSDPSKPPLIPELLPLCCCIASEVESKSLLIWRLTPHPEFCINQAWALWPLILASRSSGELRSYMLEFILQCSPKFWEIDFLLGRVVLGEEMQEFLRIGCRIILASSKDWVSDSNICKFVEFCGIFLLFRSNGNEALEKLFSESPFKQPQENVQTNLDFFSSLSEIREPPKEVFGIFLSSDAEWKYKLLAIDLTHLIIFLQIRPYYYLAATLTSLLTVFSSCEVSDLITDEIKGNSYISLFSPHSSICKFENFENLISKSIDSRTQYSIQTVRLLGFVYKFYIKSKRKADKFRSLKSLSSNFSDDKAELRVAMKQWQHLWRRVSAEHCPWNVHSLMESHLMRDSTMCSDFCPMRMKINAHFNDHKDASFLRDIGSVAQAKIRIEEYHRKIESEKAFQIPKVLNLSKKEMAILEKVDDSGFFLEVQSQLINLENARNAKFLLYEKGIRLRFESGDSIYIAAKSVRAVFFNALRHLPSSIEVYTLYGKSYFIYFPSENSLSILKKMESLEKWSKCLIQTTIPREFISSQMFTEEWRQRKISNFRYLMLLNIIGGRSFNDASVYPVFPWVLKDYSSETLDIDSFSIYRDFSKPIGAFGADRLREIEARYRDLKQFNQPVFLYSACYSSPLCVYLWLMREEPFTTLHIDLQSGKFDHSARLFSSIQDAFRMATSHMNDFRELIPEFFFCPSFLVNANNFDLGQLGGSSIGDVALPPWAHGLPDAFVYLHRKALESEYVSENIHRWIDLIFGYQQSGEEAEKAKNTYDPTMYESAWTPEVMTNPEQFHVVSQTMEHCGQIPSQLFTRPHPQREILKVMLNPRVIPNISIMKDEIFDSTLSVRENILYITLATISKIAIYELDIMSSRPPALISSQGINFSKDSILIQPQPNYVTQTTAYGDIILNDLKRGQSFQLFASAGQVNCLDFNQHFVVSGGSDTTTTVWKNKEPFKQLFSIPSYRSEVTCVSIGSSFGVIASGLKDGSIQIISISKQTVSHVINTGNGYVKKVCVTPSWGFVVANIHILEEGMLKSLVSVYYLYNSQPVRSIDIGFQIRAWKCWSDTEGFDFMAVADDKGNLYIFEVFFLELTKPVLSITSQICSIEYAKEVLIVIDSNGVLHFVDAKFYSPRKAIF